MLRDVGDKKFEPMRLLQMRMLFIFFVTTTNLETLDSSCNLGTTVQPCVEAGRFSTSSNERDVYDAQSPGTRVMCNAKTR